MREILTITDTPLFANLPFLRLKDGEHLVKGETTWEDFKGGRTYKSVDFYVKREGKYHRLSIGERDGRRMLNYWRDAGLFDWETTPDNAEKLWEWSSQPYERLTIPELRNVQTALLPEFAEYLGYEWQSYTEFEDFRSERFSEAKSVMVPIPQPGLLRSFDESSEWPGKNYIFAGSGFKTVTATFYVFQIRLGAAGIERREKDLLVGPERVDEEYFRGSYGPNSSGIYAAKGRALIRLRAQQARYEKFRNLVARALSNPSFAIQKPAQNGFGNGFDGGVMSDFVGGSNRLHNRKPTDGLNTRHDAEAAM